MIRSDRIWLAVEPVDMRLGMDGLSSRLQNGLGRAPCDGSLYVFTNRARTRLKALVTAGVGWHRRVAVPATTSSASVWLAACCHRGVSQAST